MRNELFKPYARGLSRAAWLVAIVGVIILAQWAFLSAYRLYLSEAYSSESSELSNRKQYPQARERAVMAAKANPYNGYAVFHVATNDFLMDRYPQAVEALLKAQPFMPHLPNLLRLLAQAEFFAKNFAASAQTMERYFTMDPLPEATPDRMFRLYAHGLYRAQRLGDAAVAFGAAELYETFRNELLQSRSVNALLLNQITSADYASRRFHHLYPNGHLDAAELFSGALAMDKIPIAMRFLEVLRQRGEADLPLLKVMVLGYIRMGQTSEALNLLKYSIQQHPNDAELFLYLGDISYRANDMQTAKSAYRRHLLLNPQSKFKKEIQAKFSEKL